MPRNPNHNPVAQATVVASKATAKATKALIRASPPIQSISRASASLNKAAISNRHYVRALLSLVATRNLIKSIIFFRPVNRKTLKPGSPLWKTFLKAIWLAIWPSLGKSLAERFVEKTVPEGVEVEACEKDVSKEKEMDGKKEGELMVREGELVVEEKEGVRLGEKREEVIVKVEPQQVAGALVQYAADLRAMEKRARESARMLEEQERAFQEQFAQVEGLVTAEEPILPAQNTTELTVAAKHERELAQMWEREELAKQQVTDSPIELVIRSAPSQTAQSSLG